MCDPLKYHVLFQFLNEGMKNKLISDFIYFTIYFFLQATWDRPQPQKLLKNFLIFTLKIAYNTKNFGKFGQKTVEKAWSIQFLSNRWFLSRKSCFIFKGLSTGCL